MRITLIAVGVAVAALTACGGATSRHAARTPARTVPTAASVTGQLQAAGLPIPHGVTIYTVATDPNHLLGRPGEYTSKTEWADLRYPLDADAECGVEVFPTAQLAAKRAGYVQSLMGGLLGTEYDYLAGPVLLRISGVLTPAQAAAYGRAAHARLYALKS